MVSSAAWDGNKYYTPHEAGLQMEGGHLPAVEVIYEHNITVAPLIS